MPAHQSMHCSKPPMTPMYALRICSHYLTPFVVLGFICVLFYSGDFLTVIMNSLCATSPTTSIWVFFLLWCCQSGPPIFYNHAGGSHMFFSIIVVTTDLAWAGRPSMWQRWCSACCGLLGACMMMAPAMQHLRLHSILVGYNGWHIALFCIPSQHYWRAL